VLLIAQWCKKIKNSLSIFYFVYDLFIYFVDDFLQRMEATLSINKFAKSGEVLSIMWFDGSLVKGIPFS
jgi:hypothetical protein